jgi:eukaryotic-like serine/threonine-protein kinase
MSTVRELQPGEPPVIGPYRLRGLLGVGGTGRVFLGVAPGGQLVAVKVIRAELATDPEFRMRFRQEVAVARTVSGPFTAPVIDADADAPLPWLATAYVPGPSLDDAVAERGPLPTWTVLKLAAGLAEGLSAIHAAGVVHRDLKPSNVLLAKDGPRLIDFGISRASGASALSHPGLLVGSPGFVSPEQAEGQEAGPPGDVFSLGAVLAFAATGKGPFGAGSTLALVYRVIHCPPDLDMVPAEVQPLVRRCLAQDPGLRPTARELLAVTNATRSLADGPPEPAIRTFARSAARAGPRDATTPMPVPGPLPERDPRPAPGGLAPRQDTRHRDRHPWRRSWRPLVAAAIIAGLAGAAAAAGVTLASTHHTSPAAQAEGQATSGSTTPPAAFALPSSAEPRTSQPAATVRNRSTAPAAAAPVHTAPPVVAFTRPASTDPPSLPRTAAPKTSATTPTATPPPSAAPTLSAVPTPTSAGY